ncbi:XdhC/CoxF family protein [Sinorhizobium fredii USDA 205]|uniref:XdhC family protein n=1 Tax=Rhizobium fredii TaxID=380 RepID=A0A844AI88_RHIFR|nr:XdhC family protein [Sinorhizobium fredii]AWM25026.1 Carbon monoxide dehydrogenase F protein [Sinorhizobium fredii CCBAU 25509]KSV89683.1 XdhC/CoxF family protein [Sinorhizobium fredii USDA 205]MQW93690.1 XdhC family protein [Sinorhizobium fredii]MQX12307.1 XdhC family protein [Sinorhizobium fredii]UTY49316.1 XdhC family protein [Sinorhizobium fredii]
MQLPSLQKLNEARAARRAAVVVNDLSSGRAQAFIEREDFPAEWDAAISETLRSGRPNLATLDERPVFINVYLPPPRLVVIGAVHITQALARLAPVAGFDMTIIDPRTAFATVERFEGVELLADWPEDVLPTRPLDRYTALAAVTHDPKIDDYPIRAALDAGCFYVGALGSRKTHASRVERLRAAGLSEEAIGRIRAPIGLDIGAASPAEIAIAVLAEIIGALRHRDRREEGLAA